MNGAVTQRLIAVIQRELARGLGELCSAVGAAESSILLPRDGGSLFFFVSSNPALMAPGAPVVPIGGSFSGLAFRTGQTIAFADAAVQEAHNKAVDEHVGHQTREFAAIPIYDQFVVGVLTLVNRPAGTPPRPFDMPEMRQATALAQDIARAVAMVASLAGGAGPGADDDLLDAVLMSGLTTLTEPERRIVHSLVDSILQNRAE